MWLAVAVSTSQRPLEASQTDLAGPSGTFYFGTSVTLLPNGNFVVTDSTYSLPGRSNVGAVYLYHGTTLQMISALTGTTEMERLGSYPITVLKNGNYLIQSPIWNGGRGAVSLASGTTGVSGTVGGENWLVGGTAGDYVGYGGITVLENGHCVVSSPSWNGRRGAITLINGTTGISGTVGAGNSLVGSLPDDKVGSAGISELGNGNYLVISPFWNGNRGALTWRNGTTAGGGTVGAGNSLVGTTANDYVGSNSNSAGRDDARLDGIFLLRNGNYLVHSRDWNGMRGAVTWASGTTGVSGTVGAGNSLVGSAANDSLGGHEIYELENGNYVVSSGNGGRGAVTWGSGTTGVSGTVGAGNSLVGSIPGDQVGGNGISELGNGNYVVRSLYWNGYRGAVTWGSGTTGVSGTVGAGNSLVGSTANDYVGNGVIAVLRNGNYVVGSPFWNEHRGAATWGSGTMGVCGAVGEGNSLVGSTAGDRVGSGGISVLGNGNYLVCSPSWNGNKGAATWRSGAIGGVGTVGEGNSLVGSTTGDQVGSGGISVLANGNFVVCSPAWNGNRGAATWGSGTMVMSGTVGEGNSLVGSTANDQVSEFGGISEVGNGNYLVRSGYWNEKRGAVTWGSGMTGVSGVVGEGNSLVGSSVNDFVGCNSTGLNGITVLGNGNYVVSSLEWNGSRGSVTWGSGTTGVSGTVGEGNSLVGTMANDLVGRSPGIYAAEHVGITELENGDYVVRSPYWNGNWGAVTWGSGTKGVSGAVGGGNSLVGSTTGDYVGYGGILELGNGSYVVRSHRWNENRGAVTWSRGRMGVSGPVGAGNSLVGTAANDIVGSDVTGKNGIVILEHGNYVVRSPYWNGHRGAVTWGSGMTGVSGEVNPDNSVIGNMPSGGGSMDVVVDNARSRIIMGYRAGNRVSLMGFSPLEVWRRHYFPGAISKTGMMEDFDSDGVRNLFEFAFGTNPGSNLSGAAALLYEGTFAGAGSLVSTGQPAIRFESLPEGIDFRALFVRRKDYAEAGLTYTLEFSANLSTWQPGEAVPRVLADDGTHQIVSVPYPASVTGGKARFFRLAISHGP